jgi:hypothetical protein
MGVHAARLPLQFPTQSVWQTSYQKARTDQIAVSGAQVTQPRELLRRAASQTAAGFCANIDLTDNCMDSYCMLLFT